MKLTVNFGKNWSCEMKGIIGILLFALGILLGLYVGIWLCFIGGIVQVIEQIRAENLEPVKVAIGIARVFSSAFAGYVSALILIFPGYALFKKWLQK